MKKILVTGGFGFLGGHLVEEILRHDPGCIVHVIDNLSTNPIPHELFLEGLKDRKRVTFDLCSIAEYFASGKPRGWSQIYHLASIVGPAGVLKHGGYIVRAVIDDSYLVMDEAIASGVRLLDVSTSEIYGGGQEGYCREDFPKIIPAKTSIRLEYAVAKIAAETSILNNCSLGKLDAVIIRPFNISGPRQSGVGGFVVPRFVGLAMHGHPLTVFGKGNQIRAFTHVKDMAEGICLAMNVGKSGEAYNLGNPENKMSIDVLADMVADIVGSKAGKIYVDPKTIYGPFYEEANDKYPDANRAIEELGWRPKRNARTVISETRDFMAQVSPELRAQLTGAM